MTTSAGAPGTLGVGTSAMIINVDYDEKDMEVFPSMYGDEFTSTTARTTGATSTGHRL